MVASPTSVTLVQCVARLLRTVLGNEVEVVLRRRDSGVVFTSAGAPDEVAVRFASAAEADAFSTRFLDEAPAWQAIPASQADAKAA
jgi:hypothetical protein